MRIIVLVLLFSQLLFAEIVGGKETSEYTPTKLYKTYYKSYNVAQSEFFDSWKKGGGCSATRISPLLILTAAHCLSDAISSILSKEYFEDKFEDINLSTILKVEFPNEKEVKAVAFYIQPEYIKLSRKFYLMKMQIIKDRILGLIKTDKERNYKLMLLSDLRISESAPYDMAIMVTENPSDDFYPVSFKDYRAGQDVELVGYGYKESINYINSMASKTLGLMAQKVSNEFFIQSNRSSYNGFKIELRAVEEIESLKQENAEIDNLIIEIEKKAKDLKEDTRKFAGSNSLVTSRESVYSIKGKSVSTHQKYQDSLSQGDSGGGLLIDRSGDKLVVGVASFISNENYSEKEPSYVMSRFSKTSLKENKLFLKQLLKQYK